MQSEIVKTLWSHSNSNGIARRTWLSVDWCSERKMFSVLLLPDVFCYLLLNVLIKVACVWLKLDAVWIKKINYNLFPFAFGRWCKNLFSVFNEYYCFYPNVVQMFPWLLSMVLSQLLLMRSCLSSDSECQMLANVFQNAVVCMQSLLNYWLHS